MLKGWRASVSLALGLPLVLGSAPAAAASSSALVVGGVTTGLGVLAALWTLLVPLESSVAIEASAFLVVLSLVGATTYRTWRVRRVGGLAFAGVAGDGAGVAAVERSLGAEAHDVLAAARARFVSLQAAWDDGDVAALGKLTTPAMLAELVEVLHLRGGDANRTEVVSLQARLLALESVGSARLATVEFSGLVRESSAAGIVPFRELWLLQSERGDAPGAWQLARQQALL